MKVIINFLKFVFLTILTVCLISLGTIGLAYSTVFSKEYVINKLEETNFYSRIYELAKSNFENYINQSGLDDKVLEDICTQEKVKKDINIMILNIYDGTNEKIDTTEISKNLNANIDKLGIKTKQNSSAISEFVKHICNEYTDTLVHSKYESKINEIYKKTTNALNKTSKALVVVLAVDVIAILIINNKKVSKDIQDLGIGIMATSIFGLVVSQIVQAKVNIQGIKIFNEAFSNSLVTILKDVLDKVTIYSSIMLFIAVLVAFICNKIVANKKEVKEK